MRIATSWVVAGLLCLVMGNSVDARQKAAPLETAADVQQLGAFYFPSVPAERLQPYIAPGYTLTPCFEGAGFGVSVLVSAEVWIDVPSVPVTTRNLTVMTCALPPAGMVRLDALNEPPWYVLYMATDSPERANALQPFGAVIEVLPEFTFEAGSELNFAFSSRNVQNAIVAAGVVASPGLPVSSPFGDFDCAAHEVRGRRLQPRLDSGLTFVHDFSKREAQCYATGWLYYDGGSPLMAFLGGEMRVPGIIAVPVEQAHYRYLSLTK